MLSVVVLIQHAENLGTVLVDGLYERLGAGFLEEGQYPVRLDDVVGSVEMFVENSDTFLDVVVCRCLVR